MARFRHFRGAPWNWTHSQLCRGRKKSRTKRRYLSAAERRLRMEQGAACPEAERPFASDAARLDPGPVNAQPNAGAEEPPTSWRESGETQSQSRRQRQVVRVWLGGVRARATRNRL